MPDKQDAVHLRFQPNREPTPEELEKAKSLPANESVPLAFRLIVVPENTSRKAYSAFRNILISAHDEWWRLVNDTKSCARSPDEWYARVTIAEEAFIKLKHWLTPPSKPLTIEDAMGLIGPGSSATWREVVVKRIGKRPKRGQPPSKRHLALMALDVKCAVPALTLRQATEYLCPCSLETHTKKCMEQLRQQINALVKLLKAHGYDFTWERLRQKEWKESE